MPDPVTGGAIAIGGSSIYGAKQAKKAAQSQSDSNDRSIEFQREMFNQSREDQAPWRAAGRQALNTQSQLLGLPPLEGENKINSMAYLKDTPGYKFQLGQGLDAIEKQLGNAGNSGAAQKAIARYTTGLAENSFNNRLAQLAQLSGTGGNVAANMGGQAIQSGGQIGGLMQNQGTINANAHINKANTLNNAINQGAQLFAMSNFNTPSARPGNGVGGFQQGPMLPNGSFG